MKTSHTLHKAITLALLLSLATSFASAHGVGHAPAAKVSPPQAAVSVDIDIQFRAALKAGDATGAAAFLSDQVKIYEGGYVESSKSEYQSHHLEADISFAKATDYAVIKREINIWGDTAVSTTEGKTTGEYRGRAINSLGTETMVMRRDHGQWRIIHIHWSSRNVPSAPK